MATIKAGTYKFKDSPTLQALRQQALRFTCTAESGVTENWYFIEVSTSQIAYNNEDADYPQTAYSNGVWNSTYSFRQTIALATDQSVSDEFYTWFKANIELSLHNQVEQFISYAYDAVVSKQGTIPTNKNLQNLVGAITSISTGVDTSDGNIEPTTVLKGYKGYAKGVAVNGAIETYDGTVEDVGITVNVELEPSAVAGGSKVTTSYLKINSTTVSETDYDFKIVGVWRAPITTNKAGETISSPTFAVTLLPNTPGGYTYAASLNIAYLTDDTSYQNSHFTDASGGFIADITEQNNVANMTIRAYTATDTPMLRYTVGAPD